MAGVGWGTFWGVRVVRGGYVGVGAIFKKSETSCVHEKLERVKKDRKREQKMNKTRIKSKNSTQKYVRSTLRNAKIM